MSGKPVGGRTLGYSTPKIDKSDPADVIQLQAPLLILAGGVCVEMAAAYFQSGLTATFTVQAERLGLNLFFFTGLMLIAVMIAAKRRGINLGPLWPAVIKLAAIAIGPTAAVDLMRPILAIIPGAIPIPGMYISLGTIAGLAMQFVLFFALLGVFFDLDESDTWYCVCVTLIVYAAVYVGLMFLRH